MPRQHLSSQVNAGSAVQQQLNALAGLHARLRQGRPATATELRTKSGDLPYRAAVLPAHSTHSPTGTSAAVVSQGGGLTYHCTSTLILGVDASRGEWTASRPSAASCSGCSTGFSRCGRFCAVVCQNDGDPQTSYHCTVRMFDTVQQCWLQALQALHMHLRDARVQFADADSPVLAAIQVVDDGSENALLVFGPSEPEVRMYRTPGVLQFWFVPQTHCVLLRTHHSMACLDLLADTPAVSPSPEASPSSSASSQTSSQALSNVALSLDWVSLPAHSYYDAALAFASDGAAVWVASDSTQQTGSRISLSVHDICTLECRGSWLLSPEGWQISRLTLDVTQRTIAVGISGHRVHVHKLSSASHLGLRLFMAWDMQAPRLTPDSCFLLGFRSRSRLAIMDARTGAYIADVLLPCGSSSSSSSTYWDHDDVDDSLEACLSSHDSSRVHVTCLIEGRLVFSVLQF